MTVMTGAKYLARQLGELYRRGFALFLLAPLIVAFVIVPEFLQHIVEIRAGMFEGIDRARVLANDPLRWQFGYAKLAGLALTMFAAARFWGVRDVDGRWWRIGDVAWVRFLIAAALFFFLPQAIEPFRPILPQPVGVALALGLSLATLPLVFAMVGALVGDRTTIAAAYRHGAKWLPLLLILLVTAYVPAFGVHLGLHRLALGQPVALVWAMMTLDALVVGLLASLTGAAFALGYRAAFPAEVR